jgi:hypothetical protein
VRHLQLLHPRLVCQGDAVGGEHDDVVDLVSTLFNFFLCL